MINKASKAYIDYVLETQTEEEDAIALIREWYEGRQFPNGLYDRWKYLSPTMRDLVEKYPMLNIVERTVRVLNERIRVDQIDSDSEDLKTLLNDWWKDLNLSSLESEIYEKALRDKAAILLLDWDFEKQVPKFVLHELWDGKGGTCRIHYDENDKVSFVSKRWVPEDTYGMPTGEYRMTLYFPDRIERWIGSNSGDSRLMTPEEIKNEIGTSVKNPQPWVDAENKPMGIAAVVFENFGYRSECEAVISAQAGLNDSILDWHTSSRYHGIPTVLFEGVSFRVDPMTGKEIEPEWTPGKGLAFDSGRVSRLQPVDISALFKGAVLPWIEVAALQKGWPIHVYTQMPPSGETLRQMESPLVTQCDDRKTRFEDAWRSIFNQAVKLHNLMSGDSLEGKIVISWKSSVSLNELYEARVAQTNARAKKAIAETASLSQLQVLREMNYSEDEANRIWKERQKELDLATERKVRIEVAKIKAAAEVSQQKSDPQPEQQSPAPESPPTQNKKPVNQEVVKNG